MDIDEASAQIWASLRVDKELASSFLAVFARFEYALKRQGFLENARPARPDWNRFVRTLSSECDVSAVQAILQAAPHLAAKPTRRQIVDNGILSWDPPQAPVATLEGLLSAVRTSRNNLFHGGKFPMFPVDEPLRDQQLISESAKVLLACLDLDCPTARGVKDSFWRFDAE